MCSRCDQLSEELTLRSVIFQLVFFIFCKPQSRQYWFFVEGRRYGIVKYALLFSPGVLLCPEAWVIRRESVLTMAERWSYFFRFR